MGIKFDGEFTVTASPQEVYDLLADPQKFAPLLPTYRSLEVKDERTTDVTVDVGVGKIRGSAVVTLRLDPGVTLEQSTQIGRAAEGTAAGFGFADPRTAFTPCSLSFTACFT